jgi:UDP-glucose 4-epimerase
MGRVVLVTGVSRDFGGRCARRIAADPAFVGFFGVAVVPPGGYLGWVALVRA